MERHAPVGIDRIGNSVLALETKCISNKLIRHMEAHEDPCKHRDKMDTMDLPF